MPGRPSLVYVDGRVFQVRQGPSGSLELLSATLSSNFEVLSPSNPPPNRIGQCLLPFSAKSFLMLGGDGTNITEFEVWLYDIQSSTWTRFQTPATPLPRRSDHCAASVINGNSFIVYVYGGVTGLELCRDVLVLRIKDDRLSASVIKESDNWPSPRRHASLTVCQSKVWLFGGESETGQPLNDLWEFDGGLFDSCPFWRCASKGGLPARTGHESWAEGCDMFVAGGTGPDGPLNDEWRWHDGAWQQTVIFIAKDPVFFCALGLCEVGEKLEKAVRRSPFAALDGLFEDLRKKEKQFSDRRAGEEAKLETLKKQLSELRRQSSALDTYKPGSVSEEVNQALANFSEDTNQTLQTDIAKLREELTEVVKAVVDEYPLCARSGPRENPESRDIAKRIEWKLEEEKRIQAHSQSEREAELNIGGETISILEQGLENAPEVKVDPGDFGSFLKIAKQYGVMSTESQNALDGFYGMQLRCYNHLTAAVATRKEGIEAARKRLPILEQTITRLSEKLMKRFETIGEYKEDLEQWTTSLKAAEAEELVTQQYSDAMKAGESPPDNQAEVEKLSGYLLEIAQTHRQAIEDIWTNCNDILLAIDGEPAATTAPILETRAPPIESLMYKISSV